jgi:hypothetical protein
VQGGGRTGGTSRSRQLRQSMSLQIFEPVTSRIQVSSLAALASLLCTSICYSVEVRNSWRFASIPSYVFMSCCLVMHKGHCIPSGRPTCSYHCHIQTVNWCRTKRAGVAVTLPSRGAGGCFFEYRSGHRLS